MDDLEAAYAQPAGRWVRANMVVSADGAATLRGGSRELSGPGDRRVLGLLRALTDVVVVGAGTARAEGYEPVRIGPVRAEIRARLGLSDAPPIWVVSRGLDLDPDSALFGPAQAPTVVVTSSAAPADKLAALREVAEVVVHDGDVDLALLLAQLADRGMPHVLCEGGPALLADLVAAGLLEELCLTVAPLLVGPHEHRLLHTLARQQALSLEHVLSLEGFAFLRYRLVR